MARYFEVTIIGQKSGQQVINRLNFTSNNDEPLTANSVGLLAALGYDATEPSNIAITSVFGRLLAAQTQQYQIDEIIVRNLHSATDFITQPVSGVDWQGSIVVGAGDGLQTFIASKLRTNRIRTDVRRGTLSLTGGTEEQTEGADVWNSAYFALLQQVAGALNQPPTVTISGATTNFLPSVFGKERYPVPNTNPVRYAYRYWQDFTFFQANAAVGVTWSAVERVTSQVSRKIGRGS